MAGSEKKTAPIEGQIIKREPNTPRSVSVSPGVLRKQMKRDQDIRGVIDEYIKANMVEGKDYGSITVKNGVKSKPSLFKPGAEKFCGLFKIRPTFRKDSETVEMFGSKDGIIAYICDLVDARGEVVGEGRGVFSVSPNAADFDINKAVKIAEKRAQIDAVLRTGALSDFFTQDMEDAPRDVGNNSTEKTSYPASDKQRALVKKLLDERGVSNEEAIGYLMETYGVSSPLTSESASFVIGEMIDENKAGATSAKEMARP